MKIGRTHWQHYFGGFAVLLILIQLLSGLFLTMFYMPTLQEAYTSIKFLYTDLASWSWLRDTHRWISLTIFIAIVVHAVRSLFRGDFTHRKKRMRWLTGVFLVLPMLLFLVTGLILPWEWKGYWFMEMVPNYLGSIPLIGPSLKEYSVQAFTLPRDLVAHILILPIISIILIDIHCFTKLRKKGIFRYLGKHALITVPLLVAVIVLAFYIPMPTQDPEIIPLPLDGANIPASEWLLLIFLLPFMYFKGAMAPFLGLFLPLIAFLALAFLPYYVTRKKKEKIRGSDDTPLDTLADTTVNTSTDTPAVTYVVKKEPGAALKFAKIVGTFVLVLVAVTVLLGGVTWGTYKSPTMGCSSCHNLYLGNRMGVPPKTFKDRKTMPLLDDNEWMMRHWFNPQIVW